MTITEFLLARIAEDEETARSASGESNGRWRSRLWNGQDQVVDADCLVAVFPELDMPRDHVARHDPARVLAECEVKRRIVEEHPMDFNTADEEWVCLCCEGSGGSGQPWPCVTMCLLTLPYADHPDYRQEWKP